MEGEKKTYPKWVGLVMGLILPGSAQFLSGVRRAGATWLATIMLCPMMGMLILAIPGKATCYAAFGLVIAWIGLYIAAVARSWRPVPRIGAWGWGALVLVSIAVSGVIRCPVLLVHGYAIQSGGMAPTIKARDHIMTETVTYLLRKPARGDVVVFIGGREMGASAGRVLIQRVAGLPGERIRVSPPNILVNGKELKEPGIFGQISDGEDGYGGYKLAEPYAASEKTLLTTDDEVVLGEDEYFVVGDNTARSLDSRYWGPVKRSNIIGRATRIWWPMDRMGESLTVKER